MRNNATEEKSALFYSSYQRVDYWIGLFERLLFLTEGMQTVLVEFNIFSFILPHERRN